MEHQPIGVWLRDGRTVYILKEANGFRKGTTLLENVFTIGVQAPNGPYNTIKAVTAAEEQLAERIKDLLNADTRPSETVQDIVARVMDGHGL